MQARFHTFERLTILCGFFFPPRPSATIRQNATEAPVQTAAYSSTLEPRRGRPFYVESPSA
jgi:hypothetical protein